LLCCPDLAFTPPGITISTNADEACKGVDVAVMVGGFPRKAGMERKDVMSKNVSIYASQAAALEKHANKGVKVCPLAGVLFSHASSCERVN
jgi:malate dehydrogenase